MLLQGTLGSDFDIFAASGESTAFLWKTRSKTNWREGLSCSPIRFFQHRIRSACVDNGCILEGRFGTSALHLLTPENEGGDETSSPSPPNFFL